MSDSPWQLLRTISGVGITYPFKQPYPETGVLRSRPEFRHDRVFAAGLVKVRNPPSADLKLGHQMSDFDH